MVKIRVGLDVDASKRRWHAQLSVLAMKTVTCIISIIQKRGWLGKTSEAGG